MVLFFISQKSKYLKVNFLNSIIYNNLYNRGIIRILLSQIVIPFEFLAGGKKELMKNRRLQMSNPGELIIRKLLEWSKIVLPRKYWNVL
jgi:phage-related protein